MQHSAARFVLYHKRTPGTIIRLTYRLPASQRRMEARLSMINTVVNGLKLPSYFIKKAGRRNEYGANPFFRPVEANSYGA